MWKDSNAKNIFSDSQYSVVELKSNTGDNIVSYGTAVIIDDEGVIISNAHMVTYKSSGLYIEYENYSIRFSFETEYRMVSLVKYDLEQDIAVLRLEDITNLTYKGIDVDYELMLETGDIVYAIGNGMNHGIGMTEGLICLPQVNIEYNGIIRRVIQCDLVINEGNSGGALLNSKGQLIGITTFRTKDISGNINYGIAYCIPINQVLEYLDTKL